MFDSVVDWFVLLAFWSPGPSEMMVLAAVALLLYGGKLPEVARSWGKTFAEFRRSLSGIQNDINDAIYSEPQRLEYQPERTSYSDDSLPDPEEYPNSKPVDASTPDDDAPDDNALDENHPVESPADEHPTTVKRD